VGVGGRSGWIRVIGLGGDEQAVLCIERVILDKCGRRNWIGAFVYWGNNS